MNIVVDGQERYVAANPDKILRARRLVLLEVCRAYQADLENAGFLGRFYLRCKRWLELKRKLAQLDHDVEKNLYLNVYKIS